MVHSRFGMIIHLNCNVLTGHLPPLIKIKRGSSVTFKEGGLELYPSEFVTSDSLSIIVRLIWLVVVLWE